MFIVHKHINVQKKRPPRRKPNCSFKSTNHYKHKQHMHFHMKTRLRQITEAPSKWKASLYVWWHCMAECVPLSSDWGLIPAVPLAALLTQTALPSSARTSSRYLPDAHWQYLCLSDSNLSLNMATVLSGEYKGVCFFGDVSNWEVFVCVLCSDI